MKQTQRNAVQEVGAVSWWRRYPVDSLLAAGGVGLVTALITFVHLYPRIPTSPLIYMLLVLALASTRSLYAAFLASLLAFLAFDFFLVPPAYTFSIITIEDLLSLAVFLIAAIVTSELASMVRRHAEQARNRERDMRLLYEQAQQLAALQERQRLARELHDSVSQALYGISLGAYTTQEALESNDLEQAMTSIRYVLTLAEAGLAEMRALIFELRPESLETEGLVAALNRQVAVLRTRYNLTVDAELGEEPELSLDRKEAIYRIAQEALHNIVKHAHATTVNLRLIRREHEILLEVQDNGRGFDPAGPFPGHLGLRSMQERASKMGGTLSIKSAPGEGTCIHMVMPVLM